MVLEKKAHRFKIIYVGYHEMLQKLCKGVFSWSRCISDWKRCNSIHSVSMYRMYSESFMNLKTDDSSLRILEFRSFSRSNDLTPSRDKKNHPMISNIGGLFFHQAFFFIQKLISLWKLWDNKKRISATIWVAQESQGGFLRSEDFILKLNQHHKLQHQCGSRELLLTKK